jgi:dTDP-4-dehydrorhamnose 3,5-epimerase
MKIIKTKFSNLLIFQGKKNKDSRGHLVEIFKQNLIKNKLKFDYFTVSKKNVLRGMHFQLKKQQDKLISVIKGKIIDFSIDLRKNSKTFGKIFKKELSDNNCISLYIPKGFAHGFYAMEKENIVLYKNSEYRDPKYEMGISILDKNLNLKLPKKKFILSKKDKKNITLKEFIKKYKSL